MERVYKDYYLVEDEIKLKIKEESVAQAYGLDDWGVQGKTILHFCDGSCAYDDECVPVPSSVIKDAKQKLEKLVTFIPEVLAHGITLDGKLGVHLKSDRYKDEIPTNIDRLPVVVRVVNKFIYPE